MTNLKQLRTNSGLSQQALAEKFNLSQQSIYKYENDLAEPDISTLKEFAHFFGVSIDYLVGYQSESETAGEGFTPTGVELLTLKKLRQIKPEVRQSIIALLESL